MLWKSYWNGDTLRRENDATERSGYSVTILVTKAEVAADGLAGGGPSPGTIVYAFSWKKPMKAASLGRQPGEAQEAHGQQHAAEASKK